MLPSGLRLRPNEWMFIAVSYDLVQGTVTLFVDGQTHTVQPTSVLPAGGSLLVGGGPDSPGFHGHIDNLFVFAEALSKDELNFLRKTETREGGYPLVAGNAGFALACTGGFGVRTEAAADTGTSIQSDGFSGSLMQFSTLLWLQASSLLHGDRVLLDKSQGGGGAAGARSLEYRLSVVDDEPTDSRWLAINLGQAEASSSSTAAEWGFVWRVLLCSLSSPLTLQSDWQHVAVTWDGLMVRVYLNGAFVDSLAWEGNSDDVDTEGTGSLFIQDFGSPLCVGMSCSQSELEQTGGVDAGFLGYIDELSVWNVSLTAADIARLYTSAPLPTDYTHVVVYFPFNEGRGVTTVSRGGSSSPGGVTATLTPLYDTVHEKSANDQWVPSSAPLGTSRLRTPKGQSVMIHLNSSDPMSEEEDTSVFVITQTPAHGTLHSAVAATKEVLFPRHLEAELRVGDVVTSRDLVFVPDVDFIGDDALSFRVFRTVEDAVQLTVTVAPARRS